MNVIAIASLRLLPEQGSVHISPQELYNKEKKPGFSKDTGPQKPP